MTDFQSFRVGQDHCPDCGGKGFWSGPEAGLGVNIQCKNDACGSWFNLIMIGSYLKVDRIKCTTQARLRDVMEDQKWQDCRAARSAFWRWLQGLRLNRVARRAA